MFKKGISVFLSLTVLLLCVCSVPVFASEPEFDINDYTIEDLYTMTTAEKKELIANFIETYNPYGMRDLLEQETQTSTDSKSEEPQIELYWKSDGDKDADGQQMATHQLITLEALEIYISDYGFFNINGTQALAIALSLSAASGLPDLDETFPGFAGHFYDPIFGVGTNILYKSAKDNVQEHFDAAYQAWQQAGEHVDLNSEAFATAIEELGRALHYIQDVCEPHHAANLIVGVSTHWSFETTVENHIDYFLSQNIDVTSAFYAEANNLTAGDLAHKAAQDGRSQLYYAISDDLDGDWMTGGANCVKYAVQHSARLIYKLF